MKDDRELDVEQICRRMVMSDFVDLLSRLDYSLIKYLDQELGGRIENLDRWYDERAKGDREWAIRAGNARKALAHKRSMVRRRRAVVEDYALTRLVAVRGDWSHFRADSRVQVRFLVALADREIDPERIGPDERIALSILRDLVADPTPAEA